MIFDGELVVRSRRSGVVVLMSLAILSAAFVLALLGSELAGLGVYAFYPLAIGLALHLSWTGAKRRSARFETADRSVRANGTVLRSRLASAKIIPQPRSETLVELRRRFDPYPMRIALPNLEQARAFVRSLGLDAREGMTRFRNPPTGARLTLIYTICAVAMPATMILLAAGAPLLAAIVPLTSFALLLSLIGQRVTIGTDGVLLEGLWKRRFVPYASIVEIAREQRQSRRGPMVSRGFYLVLDTGERIFLNTMKERLREGMYGGDYLFDAANAAHVAAVRQTPGAVATLLRDGRPMADWLRELRTLREARYRVAAVRDDELFAVLADPTADKTARVGAAICLASSGNEARDRVRIAVEDIAAPELRSAVDAALSEDDELLATALERL